MPADKKKTIKEKDKNATGRMRGLKQASSGYSRKTALLEEAITQMNAGRYGRASASLKELLAMDPHNMEARRLFATLHLRLGSLIPAKQAFDSLIDEAFARQDYWLAESLLREYLAAGPRCVPYLEKLGSIYQDKGQILDAVAEYAKAIDILLEDSDLDDSQHVTRLYQQIRNLAPASPAAIRLNRYFDPQTGDLIARPRDVSTYDLSPNDDDFAGSGLDDTVFSGETAGDGAPDDGHHDMTWQQESPPETTGAEWTPDSSSGEMQSAVEPELGGHAVDAASDRESVESSLLNEDVATEAAVSWMSDEPAGDALTALSDTAVNVPDVTADGYDQGSCEPASGLSGLSADLTVTLPIDVDHAAERSTPPSAFSDDDLSPATAEELMLDALSSPTPTAEESSRPSPPCEYPSSLDDRQVEQATEVEKEQVGGADRPAADMPDTVQASSDADQTEEQSSAEAVSPAVDEFCESFEIEQSPGCSIRPEADAPTLEKDGPLNGADGIDGVSWQDATVPATSVEAPVPWDHVPDTTIEIPDAQRDDEAVELADARRIDGSEAFADSVASSPPVAEDPEPALEQEIAGTGETPPFAVLSFLSPPQESGERREGVGEQNHTIISASVIDSSEEETDDNEPTFDMVDEGMVDESVSTAAATIEAPTPPEQEAVTSDTAGEVDHPIFAEPSVEESRDRLEESEDTVALPSENEATSEPPLSGATEGPAIQDLNDEETAGKPSDDVVHESPCEPVSRVEETGASWGPIRLADELLVRSSIEKTSSMEKTQPRLPADHQGRNVFTSTASSAVNILFDTADKSKDERTDTLSSTKRPATKQPGFLSRIGIRVSDWLRSCVSTTRAMILSLVALASLACAAVALGIGAVGLIWMMMEEAPSPLYQHLTAAPPRTLSDPHTNGYLFLLGFDAPAGQDPIQAGLALMASAGEVTEEGLKTNRARACLGGQGRLPPTAHAHASATVLRGWMRGMNPVGVLKANRGLLNGWAGQGEAMLSRYRQWQRLPFEDWGFGLAVAPPCDLITFAHHLYIAEGFLQQTDVGIERLEADMEAWRTVLAQAKTLPVKVLAIQAVRDNATVASGLLADPDFDVKHVGRLSHLLRPLKQEELSIRWPMRSELAWAAASYDAQLKDETKEAGSLYATVVSWFPLPKQRRLNGYAAYYDAAYKAANEGRHRGFPKRSEFSRSPAETMADVLANPIENIIGLDPLPAWDGYRGMAVDLEAHLRLASLQAWIRRGGADAELFSRIAKAGQDFYDPYTGLPMLVNLNRGVLYSVGHDGKDQDGDPEYDVVVAIPASRTSALANPSSSSASD